MKAAYELWELVGGGGGCGGLLLIDLELQISALENIKQKWSSLAAANSQYPRPDDNYRGDLGRRRRSQQHHYHHYNNPRASVYTSGDEYAHRVVGV